MDDSDTERIALDQLVEETRASASAFESVGMERKLMAMHVRDELYIVECRNVGFVGSSTPMRDLFGAYGDLNSDGDECGEFHPRFIVSVYLFNTGEASAGEIYYLEDVSRDRHREALHDPDTVSECWPLESSGSPDPGWKPFE